MPLDRVLASKTGCKTPPSSSAAAAAALLLTSRGRPLQHMPWSLLLQLLLIQLQLQRGQHRNATHRQDQWQHG